MQTFLAPTGTALGVVAALVTSVVVAALVLRVQPRRALAWTALAAGCVAVERLASGAPAGFRTLALIAALFVGMKLVVLVERARVGGAPLRSARLAAFALGWPGMRPEAFAERRPRSGAAQAFAAGLIGSVAGLALVLGARALRASGASIWAATPPLLVGLSLALHFGLFRLLEALWRHAGFGVERLFRAPLAARSAAEFWARRWNLAFSQMTSVAIARPVGARFGRRAAVLAGFLVSGLLHELAISVPVRAGFGLPTLYFALHGALVLCEPRLGPSRARTLAALLMPLPLLFHPPFLAGVAWPLLGP